MGRAQSWFESGDAGDLPASAQTTIGPPGQVLQITGQLRDANDVDLFCIRILDPATFAAELDCAVQSDPDLWLFGRAGANGVSHQDVCHIGATSGVTRRVRQRRRDVLPGDRVRWREAMGRAERSGARCSAPCNASLTVQVRLGR
jgi:hypothetical protein